MTEVHLCECGCGLRLSPRPKTNVALGFRKGDYPRFLPYHHNKLLTGKYSSDALAEIYTRCKPAPNGCLEWQGSKTRTGHCHIKIDQRHQFVHRVVWQLERGPIPEGMFVCHHCDNPPCVNIAHLYVGTPKDNVRDMHERGRFINAGKLKTHCVRGHLLSGDNVRWGGPRLSYRNCRACCAIREAARPKRTQCETL